MSNTPYTLADAQAELEATLESVGKKCRDQITFDRMVIDVYNGCSLMYLLNKYDSDLIDTP